MKKFLLAFAIVLLSAVTASAWDMKIKVGGISYEGSPQGSEIRYVSKGKTAGYARQLGNEINFTSASGQRLGSVSRLGNSWQFRDARGQSIGSATPLGEALVYRDGRGLNIGESRVLGNGTVYRDGKGTLLGEANTTSMPLRPLPLENWLIEQSIPSVCLTYVQSVTWDKPAAKAGLRAGDILIGFAGQDWTLFDVLGPSHAAMHKKVKAQVEAVREIPGIEYIVYRPAQGEKGMARGVIFKLAPMPLGLKGYRYVTAEDGPTFNRRNSINYVEQIKKLYLTEAPRQAPVSIPDAGSYRRDERAVPGAHQEFREVIERGSPRSKWVWIDDAKGNVLDADGVSRRIYQEQMKSQPTVTILSYPMAKIFLSTTADTGSGDPHLNREFKFIGMADGNGVFTNSGKTAYTLPVGAKCLAFYKQGKEYEFDVESIGRSTAPEDDPVLKSLPEGQRAQMLALLQQTPPELRSQMLAQLKSQILEAAHPGTKYVTRFGYVPITEGQASYTLAQ